MSFAVALAVRRANSYEVPPAPAGPRRRWNPGRSNVDPDPGRPRTAPGLVDAIRAWLRKPGGADADKGRDTRTERR